MSDWHSKVLKTLESVMKHPCALSFCKESDYISEDFETKIKNRLDLETIKGKLQNKEYKNFKGISNDFKVIVDNCVQIYGDSSEYAILAQYTYDLFIKKAQDFSLQLLDWRNNVNKYRNKIDNLMENSISKSKQSSSSNKDSNEEIVINDRELQNFKAAAEKLTTEEEQKEMIRIINENQPEQDTGSEELHVEITRLSYQTIIALREYMIEELSKKGMSYPK